MAALAIVFFIWKVSLLTTTAEGDCTVIHRPLYTPSKLQLPLYTPCASNSELALYSTPLVFSKAMFGV